MTFELFTKIAAQYRPDAVVHAHKAFGGVSDVAIYFKRDDGKKSKVYSYRGSYAEILNRLGIKVVTRTDILNVERMLKNAIENNGKPSLFSKGKPKDTSADILMWQTKLDEYNSGVWIKVD